MQVTVKRSCEFEVDLHHSGVDGVADPPSNNLSLQPAGEDVPHEAVAAVSDHLPGRQPRLLNLSQSVVFLPRGFHHRPVVKHFDLSSRV